MPVYLISKMEVLDPAKLKQYAEEAGPTLKAYGVRPIARGKFAKAILGTADPHAAAVIEFPDMEAVDNWYMSAEYQALILLRDEACEMQLFAYEAPTT